MSKLPISSGFSLCPAGVHVFRIYAVDYNEDFGKLEVKMVTANGITHSERFSLLGKDGEPNEKACNAFSYFAKTALNDFSIEEIDHTDLIDHFIKAEIVHTTSPSNKDPNKTVTFANMGDKAPADGFDTTPCEKALNLGKKQEKPKSDLDLDKLLNE